MSPFAELGLEADADERAVKRAYAARLRRTRPEDDPQGFQALHAAYQAALAHCRQREAAPVQAARPAAPVPMPAPVEPAPAPVRPVAFSPPAPAPVAHGLAVPPLPVPRFDLGLFVQEAMTRAGAGDPPALERWLHGIEALWSLDTKAQAGHALVSAIHRQAPPMPEACLDTLLAFFGLDTAHSGLDPLALHQLRRRIDLAWHIAPARRRQLASVLGRTQPRARSMFHASLDQLQRPFRWPQALLRGLSPGFGREVAGLVHQLCGGHLELLPASIDRRQLAFWLASVDVRAITRPRLALAGARVLAALALGLLLGVVFGSMAADPGSVVDPAAVGITVTIVLVLCAVVLAFAAWSQLVRWQGDPVPAGGWIRWLHTGLVPLLTGTGLAVELATDAPFAGWPVLLVAAWLAFARLLRSVQMPGNLRSWLWISIVLLSPAARVLAQSSLEPAWFTGPFAVVTLAVWGFDLWRRRHTWRPARAR